VATIDRAVDLLGIELIKGFALVVCVFSSVERLGIANFSIERARHHSLATAKLAKRVMIDQSRGDQAFAAGLVHDLGQIVLAIGLPAEYAAVIREARASSRPLDSVERERLGANHADVGAYLLGVWGLPAPLIAAVAYHHTPSLSPPGDRDLLAAVHIADALIDGSFENERAAHSDIPLDFAFLSSTATPIEPERWRQLVADAL
jgi:HD-like signal output (HDOD) protein